MQDRCSAIMFCAMKAAWLALAATLVVIAPLPARAIYFETAGDLIEYCGAAEDSFARSYCLGYVAGLNDRDDVLPLPTFCPPSGPTLNDLVEILVTYLKDKPELLAYRAGDVFASALISKWPCPW